MARMSISRDTTTKIDGRFRNEHANQQQSRASVGVQCNLGAEAAAPSCFSRASSTMRKRGFDEAFQPPSNDNVITSPSTKSICFPSATVHIFHDSNFKGVLTEDLVKQIDAINGGKKFVSEWFFHLTFTLPNTLKKVKETVYGRNDLVVVNIMTNHARLQHPVERTQRLLLCDSRRAAPTSRPEKCYAPRCPSVKRFSIHGYLCIQPNDERDGASEKSKLCGKSP